jgi:hypothetical protein
MAVNEIPVVGSSLRLDPKLALSVAAFYSIAISSFYLHGYWGFFGISPLEYVSFSDVVKIAIFPLVTTMLGIFIGLGNGLVTDPFLERKSENLESSWLTRFLVKKLFWWPSIFAMFAAAALVPEPVKWWICTALALVPLAQISHSKFAKSLVPDESQRIWMLFLPALALLLAFSSGRFQAWQLAHFDATQRWGNRQWVPVNVVNPSRSSLSLNESCDKPVLYLGLLGSAYFFYEKSSMEVAVVERKDDRIIYFRSKARLHETLCNSKTVIEGINRT